VEFLAVLLMVGIFFWEPHATPRIVPSKTLVVEQAQGSRK